MAGLWSLLGVVVGGVLTLAGQWALDLRARRLRLRVAEERCRKRMTTIADASSHADAALELPDWNKILSEEVCHLGAEFDEYVDARGGLGKIGAGDHFERRMRGVLFAHIVPDPPTV